jgi:hypothetical protein
MNVLIACDWSCDLLPADDRDLRHFQADCLSVICQQKWDLIIAHPPCTHLAVSGARHFAAKRADGRQQAGIELFTQIVSACQTSGAKWAIENPIGIMSRLYRKPDQIIQPWMFGHPETKATCLWLGWGLMPLVPTNDVYAEMMALPVAQRNRIHHMPPSKDRWKLRSKTYQFIADAMADQWGE